MNGKPYGVIAEFTTAADIAFRSTRRVRGEEFWDKARF